MRHPWPVFVFLLACSGSGAGDTDPEPWTLEDLTIAEGLAIRTPAFEVAAGTEIQYCYFFDVPDLGGGEALWVDRTLTAINAGSHHMNVFRVKTIVNLDPAAGTPVTLGTVGGAPIEGTLVEGHDPATDPCFKSPNWADWPLVANSQNSDPDDPYTDWVLPDGVAYRLEPGEKLMLQVHYVNASTQATPDLGKVGINFYRTAVTTPEELATLFASQQSIRICQSNPEPTYSGTCRFPAGSVTIAAANGHFHSRGTRFQIFTWDGLSTGDPTDDQRFYDSTSWDHPTMALDLDVSPPSGGGLRWTCDYRWQEPQAPATCATLDARDPEMAEDCCYTFGPIVEASEHCNVFAYYYPKVAEGDITCF
jgi:hypothetical protein